MGKDSPSTQTVKNETVPDPVTQQWRQNLFGEAQSLYNQGYPDAYSGTTVQPFSAQTISGLNMLQDQAGQGAPNLQAANDASARILGGNNPALGYAQGIAAGNQQTTAGIPQLQATANGEAMNPYLDGLYSAASRGVINDTNAQFAKAGRFGANAAYGDAVTSRLGNLADSIYAPAYENERNRQVGAAGQLAGIQQGDFARQLGGTELYGGLYSQGDENAIRAQGILPSLYEYGQQPAQTMIGVGGAYENLGQENINADMEKYYYPYQQGWNLLNQYSGIVNGIPQFGSTNQTSTGMPASNRTMGALGGAMAGAQVGTKINAPYGTAIGAILGGLYGGYG